MESIAKTGKSAELLAAEIRLIKDQTVRSVLQASIEIGERLCQAKEIVSHGEWENWLKENVDYSQSTAQNLMKIYREYGTDQASLLSGGRSPKELFGDLSYSQALTLLSLPEEDRTEFAETYEVSDMSTRELKEEIERYKAEKEAAERSAKEAEQKNKQLKDDLLKANIEKSNAESAEQAAELRADKARKEAEDRENTNKMLNDSKKKLVEEVNELKKQVAELLEAPAEISDEQKEEIERQAEERYKDQLAQLTLDKEQAEQTARELEEEKAALIRKAENEQNADLQKIQFLFERLQSDAAQLVTLADRIGGEKAEKLKTVLRQTIIQISGGEEDA